MLNSQYLSMKIKDLYYKKKPIWLLLDQHDLVDHTLSYVLHGQQEITLS